MRKIIFSLIVLLVSCQKDGSDITRDDYIGYYCGENSYPGSQIAYNTEIVASEKNKAKVVILNFANTGQDVEATISDNTITIAPQLFHVEQCTNCSTYYDWVVSGNGVSDVDKGFLSINYSMKEISSNNPELKLEGVINMYNSEKRSYLGTYTGDSITVVISPVNDSLLVSIRFPGDWVPLGWENIKSKENGCYINFSTDSAQEISTSENYKLIGSGQILGDTLKFSLRAYYHGLSPLYFIDFKVARTE